MNRTSGVSNLQARLQKTAETERQEVEAIVQGELKKLSKNLRGIVAHALYTIESDTKTWSRRLSAAALKAWARPIVIGLCDLSGHLRRELGPDAVVCHPDPKPHREAGRLEATGRAAADAPGSDVGRVDARGGGRDEVRRVSRRDDARHRQPMALHRARAACRAAFDRLKETYDRVRTAVDKRLECALEAVRGGDGAAGRAGRHIAESSAAARKKRSRT